MSIRNNSGTAVLRRNNGIPSVSRHTICLWARIDVDRNDYSGLWGFADNGGLTNSAYLGTTADGVTVVFMSNNGTETTIVTMIPGEWYFFCLSKAATNDAVCYYRRHGQPMVAVPITVMASGAMTDVFLYDAHQDTQFWLDGSLSNYMEWSDYNFNFHEAWVQSQNTEPVREANLNCWARLATLDDVHDLTGLGRSMFRDGATGMLTAADPPSLVWVPKTKWSRYLPFTAGPPTPPSVGSLGQFHPELTIKAWF